MRIIITGDKGFIGSHLKKKFAKDNLYWSWNKKTVAEIDGELENSSLLRFVDVESTLSKIRPDLIIHCAGSADVVESVSNPYNDLESNYITTHNLLFGLKKLEFFNTRFILLSSASVYGNPITLPINEQHKTKPLSPYALHKKSAEDVCFFMHENYGMDTKVLRIFSAYGPGLKKQIFWDMYKKYSETGYLKMWGNGQESRDYIYIDDLVSAITLISQKAKREQIIFNIANGEETTIREATETFAKCIGIPRENIEFIGTRREGEPINWKADIGKLKALGYVRNISFEEGVLRYATWLTELIKK